MTRAVFITGTDTGVGKTAVSVALMRAWQASGCSVLGMKPVASGSEPTQAGLVNDDALQLQRQASIPLAYAEVNPCAFLAPVAPHLAAAELGQHIRLEDLTAAFDNLMQKADGVVVEGVGGWLVPLDDGLTMADLACALRAPVIMVVAIRLGCLNHALLTAESIRHSGLQLMGWVANRMDPDCLLQEENIRALSQRLGTPLLAELDYSPDGFELDVAARRLQAPFEAALQAAAPS